MPPDNKFRLSDLQSSNPFLVPERYFEDFSRRLKDRIEAEEENSTTLLRRHPSRFLRMALAASILGFVLFTGFFIRYLVNRNGLTRDGINYATLVEQDIENYDLDQLTDLYTETADTDTGLENNVYTDAVIIYLVNEDVDLNLIIENL